MSKIILLPLSYNVNNSAVGTWTFSSSPRNYELNNAKISDLDLALGGGRATLPPYKLSESWESLSINQWAAFKPTKNPSYPSGMKVIAEELVWDKPPATPADYRLGDFGGYNHSAPIPDIDPAVDNFTFASSGTYTRQIEVFLPEFDLTENVENGACDRFWTKSFFDGGRGEVQNSTVSTLITTTDLGNNYIVIDYQLTLGTSSGDFRVEIWLGEMTREPVLTYKFPVFEVTGTATYNPFGGI